MSNFAPYRILVADDNRDTADSMCELLRLDGHEVRAVYDGRQAVETARRFRPHVVVLDINMPIMDGYEAAAALRRETADLVLLAHTSLAHPHDVERVKRAGFNGYVRKPDEVGALSSLISQCLVASRQAIPSEP